MIDAWGLSESIVHPSHAATPPATFERAGPGTSPGAIEIVLGMWMWPIMVYQKYVKCARYMKYIIDYDI